jgi:Gly-Xaa carboxypeptidase
LKAFESLEGLEKEVGDTIGSNEFFEKSLKRMQGAVRILTESFDDMGPVGGGDSRLDVFEEFHAYFEESFPLVSIVPDARKSGGDRY